MINPEKEPKETTVQLIAPEGLGFGSGGTSIQEQIEKGILTAEAPQHIYDVLTHDPNAFKAVEADDDGCGDGRPWRKIISMTLEKGRDKIKLHKTSLLRAKVFGGGLVTASSMWRAIKGMPNDGETVGQDRKVMATALDKRSFKHGAHSDDHAHGNNCGCGAIDNYPLVTANAVKYRKEITGVLEGLYGNEFQENKDAIESVFGIYETLAKDDDYFSDASGKQSMEQILRSGAVVKELSGNHLEETIVINNVRETTLDQAYFTQEVKNACIEKRKPQTIQAFSVDIWRGQDIAKEVTAIACEQDPTLDADGVYKLAYADFLIRTLAVAGTLTSGDLPVYLRQKSKN